MPEPQAHNKAPETPDMVGPAEAARPEDQVDVADPASTLQAELDGMKDKYLRLAADMENLRKRTTREVDEARKYALTGFAREMLGVHDNLTRALGAMEQDGSPETVKVLQEGVDMVHKQLIGILNRFGVQQIQAVGEKFNPDLHQAVFEVPTATHPEGTVVQEVQPGYTIADRLLRPAMVGVAKKPD